MPYAVNTGCYSTKLFVIYVHRLTLKEVFLELVSMEWKSSDPRVTKRTENLMMKFRLFSKCQRNFLLFGILFHAFTPFLNLINGGDFYQQLPYEIWLPFDFTKNKILFFITYFWMLWITKLCLIVYFTTDYIISAIIFLLCLQFILLKQKISEKDSKEIVDHHNALIKLTKKFNKLMSWPLLINLAGIVITLCLLLFRISKSDDVVDFIRCIIFWLFSLGQIFVICFFGQMLSNCSEKLFTEIYFTQWCSKSIQYWKMMIIMQLPTAKPTQIWAWKFYPINFEMFLSVS